MKIIRSIAIIFFNIVDKFVHQKKILFYLKKITLEIDCFIDVGSHKGTYTDLVIKNFKVRKILMFEPQKKIYKLIKKKYNNVKSIKIFNNAISNMQNNKRIYINRHDLTSSLSALNKKNNYIKIKSKIFGANPNNMITESYVTKTLTLENTLKKEKIKKVELLKIDTEGHELEVLLGLKKYIKKIKIILIEFHNDDVYLNYNSKNISNYLKKNNFVLKNKIKFPFTTWEDRLYVNKNIVNN